MRIKIISVCLGVFFILLILGLFRLQVVERKKLSELSQKNCLRLLKQFGTRGKILDRNGEVVVDNYLSYDLLLSVADKKSAEPVLMALARALGADSEDLKARFRKNFSGALIPAVLLTNIGLKKAITLEEIKPDFPGLIIHPHPLRFYPHGSLACHVIGYVSEIDHWRLTKLQDYGYQTKDIVGYTGVEEKYDYYLRQEEGGLSLKVDHRGRFIETLGIRPPKNGRDVQLTIDLRIQKIVEDALNKRKGSVIIMDPSNGEIIALISSPGFDPSLFVGKSSSAQIGSLFNDPGHPLFNRAINGQYPPASVFKLVVASGALEQKKINLARSFVCTGSLKIGKRSFACWHTHGAQNLIAAIAHSCDVFFYHIGLFLGPQAIHDYALMFGFGKPTGVDLLYENTGQVQDPLWKKLNQFKGWYDGDTANFSIGQGELLVTPLQVARMTAVFANGGELVRPFVVKTVAGVDISKEKKKTTPIGLKKQVLDYVREGLRQVVDDPSGTAHILSALKVSVAGKTGTAQTSRGASHGWFSGYFPFEKPKFVICVFLENGGSGGAAAGVAKNIIEAILEQGLL